MQAAAPRSLPGNARFGTLRGVQALRGIAALMVVAYHALETWNQRLGHGTTLDWRNGSAGVDIFFVISGFVMIVSSRGLIGTRDDWRIFLRQRVVRIVPLYWFFSFLKIATVAAVPALALRTRLDAGFVARSLLFLPLHDGNGAFKPLLPVGWTLTYEMLFYILFAAGLALRMPPLAFVAPVLAILALLPVAHGSVVGELCNPIALEFVFGCLVATAWLNGRILPVWLAATCLAISLAGLCLLPAGFLSARFLSWGLPASGVVAAAVSLERACGAYVPKIMRLLGDASYAIYLVHGFVLPALAAALAHLPEPARGPGVTIAVSLVASGLAGVCAHLAIEKPLTAWLRGRMPIQAMRAA